MKKVIYLLACVAFLGCYSCSDDDDGLKMQLKIKSFLSLLPITRPIPTGQKIEVFGIK